VEKMQLLKRLETILDEAKRTSMWGTVEIVLQFGDPVLIHEKRTTKLSKEGNTHDRHEQR
jgi:hypothetical protein